MKTKPFDRPTAPARNLSGKRRNQVLGRLLTLALLTAPLQLWAGGCHYVDAWGAWSPPPPPAATPEVSFAAIAETYNGEAALQLLGTKSSPSQSQVLNLVCSADAQAWLTPVGGAATTQSGSIFTNPLPDLGFEVLANGAPLPADGTAFPWRNNVGTYQVNYYYTHTPPAYINDVATLPFAKLSTMICTDGANSSSQGFVCRRYERQVVQKFMLGAVRINSHACHIALDSRDKLVTLPPVYAQTFAGANRTAGKTAFTLQFSGCPAGVELDLTLTTDNPATTVGADGVIAPAGTGYARDVGVQILRQDSQAVVFGDSIVSPTNSGPGSPSGGYDKKVSFWAQYYRTGPNVSAGLVHATARYTVTYK